MPWVGGCGQTLTREQRCDISDFHREIAAIPTAEGRGAIKAGARRSGDGAVPWHHPEQRSALRKAEPPPAPAQGPRRASCQGTEKHGP